MASNPIPTTRMVASWISGLRHDDVPQSVREASRDVCHLCTQLLWQRLPDHAVDLA